MKETGIMMSGEHPKLILEGKKTMTRRVIKPQPYATQCLIKYHPESDYWSFSRHEYDQSPHCVRCPYGQVGDRLWVKETWATENRYNHLKPSEIPQTAKIFYLADGYDPFEMGIVRPSIFMPRWASRILLEITEVRAERLQSITEEDAIAEGCHADKVEIWWQGYMKLDMGDLGEELLSQQSVGDNPPDWMIEPHKMLDRPDLRFKARDWYRSLWDSLNAKRGYGWAINPWVWVIGFKIALQSETK